MSLYRLLQSGKAAAIALLLMCAAPPVLAQVSVPAPDTLLQQLQTRTKEAEARAAEAELREREAEINRLTKQAEQAQARADAEEQGKHDAQRELFIQEAKAELNNSAYARLEILIGVFGASITILVIFFAWQTKEAAIAAAKNGIEDIRGELEARLAEVNMLVEKIRDHKTQASKIVATLRPGEAPKSVEDRKTIADAARVALAKPLKDRSADDYRTILTNYHAEEQWSDMLRTAQQMQLLHESDEDFSFARFSEAYALDQLGRSEEEIAVYEDVVARFGAAPEAALRELVASARYNLACGYAKKGMAAEAITVLRDMIKVGHPRVLKMIAVDKDFDPIRNDPAFKKFLDENGE